MQANQSNYDYEASKARIDEILSGSDAEYTDKKNIPARESLTFNNGFNVDCTALFVDLRNSKNLNLKHTKPVLAKIYKTYISETSAVLRDNSKINEIYIEGDCVWGVFETPNKVDIDEVISTSAKISSLIDTLNIKYKKRNYSDIVAGIGISYGTALMIKAGHKGSGVNEIVWLGDLVAKAADLCSKANKNQVFETAISDSIYSNLNESNKRLFSFNQYQNLYHGNIINITMNEWVKNNA